MRRFWIVMIIVCAATTVYWGIVITQAVGNLYTNVKVLNQRVNILTKDDHHVGNAGQGEIQP